MNRISNRTGRSMALALCMVVSVALTVHSQDLVSQPVGFIRIDVPPESSAACAMPFAAFADQPTLGLEAGQAEALQLLGWDEMTLRYQELDWAACPQPGQGFLLVNRSAVTQTVWVAGRVPMAEQQVVPLSPYLALLGTPYPVALAQNETPWADEVDGPATLAVGQAGWLDRQGKPADAWRVARPYAALGALEGPTITGLERRPDGCRIVISNSDAVLRVATLLVQTGSVDQAFSPTAGWETLATGIEVPPQGETAVDDPARDGSLRFYYAVWSDETVDGEWTGLIAADPVADSSPSSSGEGFEERSAATVYVDAQNGDDSLSGIARARTGVDGPKRTMAAALAIARAGDTIMVATGQYRAPLQLPAGVRMICNGAVTVD